MVGTERTALVLGATGGIGGAVAAALIARGWSVRGLARDPEGAAARWPAGRGAIGWVAGDAMRAEDVRRGAEGVSAIVHAVNPPGYRGWDRLVLPMIDNTVAAARGAGGARVVLPGTMYNFDPATTPLVGEDSPQHPPGRKGGIRVALERRLEEAAREGVPVLILRAGDFFGAEARASWFLQVLAPPGRPLRRLVHPGHPGVGHAWAYLPDLAEAMARLMEAGPRLRAFERLQFEGFWDADGSTLAAAIRRVLGQPRLPVRRFPWWLIRSLAPFGGFPREAAEIAPYWRHAMRLDNARLVALLGGEPRTPIELALRRTLAAG